jgi:hypothetical protein
MLPWPRLSPMILIVLPGTLPVPLLVRTKRWRRGSKPLPSAHSFVVRTRSPRQRWNEALG